MKKRPGLVRKKVYLNEGMFFGVSERIKSSPTNTTTY